MRELLASWGGSHPGGLPGLLLRAALLLAVAAALLALAGLLAWGLRSLRDAWLGPDERIDWRVPGPGEGGGAGPGPARPVGAAGPPLQLHVFRPRPHRRAGAGGPPWPVMLLFHGGAWQLGEPSMLYPQCRHFAAQGWLCISVGYRLGAVHGSTPADAVQDARDALRWVHAHAARLGADPARLVVGGASAGGHLAAALGTGLPALPDATPGPPPPRPRAMLLWNPMLLFAPGMPDHALVAARWQALSPALQVAPGVAPALVMSGTADPEVAPATVQDFCAALRAAGSPGELMLVPGAGHGFHEPGVAGGRHFDATNAAAAAFLRGLGLP